MGVNGVGSENYSSYNTSKSSSGELGKNEFLNLLITQLRYQDPLQPMDNTEYVSQLAQFSALEQMSNVSNGVSSIQALSMTGKMITASITDSTTGKSTAIQGMVDSVKLQNGKTVLMVEGKEVQLADVTAVYDFERSDVSSLSSLLGQNCEGYVYDPETMDVLQVSGLVRGITKGAYEDYAVMDGVEGELESILSKDYKKNQDELEYLLAHIGEEISVKITDNETGKVVPVTAELAAASKENKVIRITLNNVKVPVDGIYNVSQAE